MNMHSKKQGIVYKELVFWYSVYCS